MAQIVTGWKCCMTCVWQGCTCQPVWTFDGETFELCSDVGIFPKAWCYVQEASGCGYESQRYKNLWYDDC